MMRRLLSSLALAASLCAPALAWAAPVAPPQAPQKAESSPITITTRLTPDPSRIGDRLDLRVIAAYPAGYSVNLPAGLSLGELHVIDAEGTEPVSSGEGFNKTFNIALQVFDTGAREIPPFALTYVDPEGQVHTVEVPSHPFEVDSLIVNEPDPQRRGSDDPISLDYPNTRAEKLIYFGGGTLVGALLAWWAWSLWGRREKEIVLPPPVPAHVTAFEALDALEARREDLLERGEFQDYYLRLTEILKGYLQGRFGVDALDRTTEELRRELEIARGGQALGELDVRELIKFLQDCDLVKFARFAPPLDEAHGALTEVRDIVERSQPQREEPAPAEEEEAQSSDETEGKEDAA
jgi:hypothetical protein